MNSPIAACIVAAGSPTAGILLYRIEYWMKRTKMIRNGLLWSARPRAEWLADTGLSRHQYDLALSRLKARGLIVVEQHLCNNRAITFVRRADTQVSQKPDSQVYHAADTQVSPKPETPIELEIKPGDKPGEYEAKIADSSPVGSPFEAGKKENSDPGEGEKKPKLGVVEGGLSVNAKEYILQAQAAQKPEGKTEMEQVKQAWRQGMAARGKFVPAFTQQELGQFKHLITRTPKGKAVAVVAWAVAQWDDFAGAVKDQAGAFNLPGEPRIGFLLKFVAIAVDRQVEASKPKEKYMTLLDKKAKGLL